ncbi:c-type cytochrome [Spirosoma sp. HMF4905]|uniref:C-type cytochrome n=1 Tax=Spirosoma arboris TaxID=2682092 RepID=A0A7K1S703_9BACT|nr:HEAT repeat domain-containing protein [Spirosoma arboris]MVM29607.1 c-type cytochrome [Spirosoma arboris]
MRLHAELNPSLKSYLFPACLLTLSLLTSSCNQSYKSSSGNDFARVVQDTNPPVEPLSPQASIEKIQLPPGYHIELVASEPMIQEPVALAWDGNGRLYVAEMNTYMTDASATGEYAPTSRIKRLEDTDGDGKMDKSTIFIDSLVLPRTILPVGDQLLVGITNVQHIWSYRDTNGDGKADEKKIVFRNDAIDSRNLEHQNGGMIWNLDNWIYPTRDNLRYKYKNGKLQADTLVDNMIGQWGMTTDNYGRLFYSEAGPGLPAVQIQQNPAYGALNFADQYSEDFTKPWPIIGNVDAQGGREALRPEDNTLNKFTAGCGQSIFRGDRLPVDMQGDYFIPEPVGRIIKRGKVSNRDGKIYIEDAYKQKDWLASADMNFRPINTYTGPDGCFYIVDMYHGIIQESEWTKPGSYLGGIIQQKGLYKNRGMGRIYRVVHDDFKRDTQRPNMLNEPSSKLINYLDHPNGWWRDNAQQLLIIRNDQTVVPTLKQIAIGEKASLSKQPSPLARTHALWTLEGLDAIDKSTLFKAFTDSDAQVRKTAVWISEYYLKRKDPEVIAKLATLKDDSSPDVRFQLALSLRSYKTPQTQALVKTLLADNPKNELMQFSFTTFAESQKILQAEQERTRNLSPADRALVTQGATIFKQLCATCHGPDGKGITMGGKQMPAPPLVGSPRVKGDKTLLMQLLLNGMRGPVDGKTYPDMMPSMAANDDKWIASVLSYVRNSSELGNKSSVVTPEEVAYTRANTPVISAGMTQQELEIFKLGRAERTNWSKSDDKDKSHK